MEISQTRPYIHVEISISFFFSFQFDLTSFRMAIPFGSGLIPDGCGTANASRNPTEPGPKKESQQQYNQVDNIIRCPNELIGDLYSSQHQNGITLLISAAGLSSSCLLLLHQSNRSKWRKIRRGDERHTRNTRSKPPLSMETSSHPPEEEEDKR